MKDETLTILIIALAWLVVPLIVSSMEKINKNKSNSQRLRAVLYRTWEQSGSSLEFEHYYNAEMNKIIDSQQKPITAPNDSFPLPIRKS